MKTLRGSFTIEAAVIVPIILLIFGVLVHILFYWHDKNILMSTAHETAALGSGESDLAELDLEYYFFDRMEGKLLLFDRVECLSYIDDDKVTVQWDASKGRMVTKGEYSVTRTRPADYIREIRKLKKLGEGIVKKD